MGAGCSAIDEENGTSSSSSAAARQQHQQRNMLRARSATGHHSGNNSMNGASPHDSPSPSPTPPQLLPSILPQSSTASSASTPHSYRALTRPPQLNNQSSLPCNPSSRSTSRRAMKLDPSKMRDTVVAASNGGNGTPNSQQQKDDESMTTILPKLPTASPNSPRSSTPSSLSRPSSALSADFAIAAAAVIAARKSSSSFKQSRNIEASDIYIQPTPQSTQFSPMPPRSSINPLSPTTATSPSTTSSETPGEPYLMSPASRSVRALAHHAMQRPSRSSTSRMSRTLPPNFVPTPFSETTTTSTMTSVDSIIKENLKEQDASTATTSSSGQSSNDMAPAPEPTIPLISPFSPTHQSIDAFSSSSHHSPSRQQPRSKRGSNSQQQHANGGSSSHTRNSSAPVKPPSPLIESGASTPAAEGDRSPYRRTLQPSHGQIAAVTASFSNASVSHLHTVTTRQASLPSSHNHTASTVDYQSPVGYHSAIASRSMSPDSGQQQQVYQSFPSQPYSAVPPASNQHIYSHLHGAHIHHHTAPAPNTTNSSTAASNVTSPSLRPSSRTQPRVGPPPNAIAMSTALVYTETNPEYVDYKRQWGEENMREIARRKAVKANVNGFSRSLLTTPDRSTCTSPVQYSGVSSPVLGVGNGSMMMNHMIGNERTGVISPLLMSTASSPRADPYSSDNEPLSPFDIVESVEGGTIGSGYLVGERTALALLVEDKVPSGVVSPVPGFRVMSLSPVPFDSGGRGNEPLDKRGRLKISSGALSPSGSPAILSPPRRRSFSTQYLGTPPIGGGGAGSTCITPNMVQNSGSTLVASTATLMASLALPITQQNPNTPSPPNILPTFHGLTEEKLRFQQQQVQAAMKFAQMHPRSQSALAAANAAFFQQHQYQQQQQQQQVHQSGAPLYPQQQQQQQQSQSQQQHQQQSSSGYPHHAHFTQYQAALPHLHTTNGHHHSPSAPSPSQQPVRM